MAKFTQTQAENTKTTRDERYAPGGVHSHYIFTVTDNNGNAYKWTDKELSSKATKEAKKAAICAYLKTIDKIPAEAAPTVERDKHDLIGKKIKDA